MVRKICVLIEDDPADRALFASAMVNVACDFDVLVFGNAQEAIRKIRDREIIPDVIFLDMNMPGINGYQFLVYLKGQIRYSRIPVIVYSTTADPLERTRTRKMGAAGFFERPAAYSELSSKLTEMLADIRILNTAK
jgi:CheY-like chemotaxis protein